MTTDSNSLNLDVIRSQIENDPPEPQFAQSVSRIGNGPHTTVFKTLEVHVPLNARIGQIKGYLRNTPWPDGCDLKPTTFVEVNLNNINHDPIGWSGGGNVTQGSTATSQFVTAEFRNWSHCNPRECRLRVYYTLPTEHISDVQFVDVDPDLLGPNLPPDKSGKEPDLV